MENEKMDGYDYFLGKKPNRTYASKRLADKLPDGSKRDLRIVSKVMDSQEFYTHENLKGQVVLRLTLGGRQQITAKLYEDTREVRVLSLQRYSTKNGNPHEWSFSFVGDEIKALKNFIDSLELLDFSSPHSSRIEDDQLVKARELLMSGSGIDLLIEMAQQNITKRDVVALAFRKEQLQIFSSLLFDSAFFSKKQSEWNMKGGEAVWQAFFEKNPWIFGYGLSLIFNEPLQGKKLEQVVIGFDITGSGKRVDGLLKTRGVINSLCFIEIKTHETGLLKQTSEAYRADCWQLSDELNGGVAQIQKTTQKALENIGAKLNPQQRDGRPTGEDIYLYQPKSYLVIGSLSQFATENGINKEKFSSFELFRRSITNPEIITFDELYERAKYIVHNNEEMS